MSRVADASLLSPSRLLEREPYVLSDPRDPSTPNVTEAFRLVLDNRRRALDAFFVPNAYVVQEVRRHLVAERCIAVLVGGRVRVPGREEVRDYLFRHPDIVGAVLSISMGAMGKRSFGDEVSVELRRDPETEDQYLAVYLRRAIYDQDTLDIITTLGEEAEALLAGKSGWILVSTDFRRPEGS